jgi:hypothetical protein
MARSPMTEEAILAHLVRLAAPAEDRLYRHQRFVRLAEALSRELEPMVSSALLAEAVSQEAEDWLELFAQMQPDAALSQAARRELLRPNAAEISRETRELAQCLLANWIALQCFRQEDGLPAFVLPANGEQISWPMGLFDGIEAFAAPPEGVARLFEGFLAKHPSLQCQASGPPSNA